MTDIKKVLSISPFIDGLLRSFLGLMLNIIVIAYFAPEEMNIVIVSELPITATVFVGYVATGVGLLFSGYISTLMIEVFVLFLLSVFRRLKSSPEAVASK